MPFSSQAQRRLMYSRHPDIAARWRKESGPQLHLRERAPAKKGKHDARDELLKKFLAKHRK